MEQVVPDYDKTQLKACIDIVAEELSSKLSDYNRAIRRIDVLNTVTDSNGAMMYHSEGKLNGTPKRSPDQTLDFEDQMEDYMKINANKVVTFDVSICKNIGEIPDQIKPLLKGFVIE